MRSTGYEKSPLGQVRMHPKRTLVNVHEFALCMSLHVHEFALCMSLHVHELAQVCTWVKHSWRDIAIAVINRLMCTHFSVGLTLLSHPL
jgi:hypothetical protein